MIGLIELELLRELRNQLEHVERIELMLPELIRHRSILSWTPILWLVLLAIVLLLIELWLIKLSVTSALTELIELSKLIELLIAGRRLLSKIGIVWSEI